MSADQTTRVVRSWLEEGVTALPDRVLDAVLDQLPAIPQRRRLGSARRSFEMHPAYRFAIAAAAVLVIAVVAYQLAPFIGVGRPGRPTPSPSPVPSQPVWDGPGTLDAGTWAMDVGSVRITFDIPAARWQENVVPDVIWQSGSEGRFGFDLVDNVFVDPCDPAAEQEPPIGPTVDALADALTNLAGIDATGPTDVTLGGYTGKLVEIDLAASARPCGEDDILLWAIPEISQAHPLETGAVSRFWILDVEGTRLVVFAVERDNFPTTLRTELQQILDSIRLEPS
jgi:hypothetical protein